MTTVRKVRRSSGRKSSRSTRTNTLPTTLNEPPTSFMDFTSMFYGRKGIGKTTLAASLARTKQTKVLVMMLEKTRKNLKIYQVPRKGEKYPDWSKVLQYTEDFINSSEFGVIVIDTLDRLYDLCYDYVCKMNNVKSPKQAGKNASSVWVEISSEFNAYLQILGESGKGIIFISHEKIRELESKRLIALKKEAAGDSEDEGEEFKIERIEPSASPSACRAAEEMCDFVFYYGYNNRQRTLTVRDQGDYTWVSCGLDNAFLDPQGNPISQFIVGDTPTEAKKNLLDAFANKVQDIDYVPPKRTTKRRRVRK